MPDDIIISELSNAPQIDDSAVFPLTQDNGGSPATFKASMSQIAGKIGEGTTFANLQTTSKTLVGALNELKAGGGGGSVDITTEIDTPSAIQTFSDGGDNIPMKSCEVAIVAQQASGTPSPSNPLLITGFSSVEVSVSDGVTPTTTNVSLGQTIYGGTADLVGGNGTKTYSDLIDLGDLTWTSTTQGRWISTGITSTVKPAMSSSSKINGLCTHYEILSADDVYLQNTGLAVATNGVISIYDSALVGLTAEQVKTALTGYKFTFELLSTAYSSFTFTGANIPTLSGVNNVYADSGDINELEYFNDKADDIADLDRAIDYHKYTTTERVVGKWIDGSTLYEKTFDLSNVTFTDNAWNNDILGTASSGIFIRKFDGYFSLSGSSMLFPLCYYRKSDEYFTCSTNNDASDLNVRPNMNAGATVMGSTITIQYTKSST